MKIPIQDILPTQPKKLHFEGKEAFLKEILGHLTADEAPLAKSLSLPLAPEIHADVELARDGRTVFITGDAHAVIQVPCARCLKPLTLTLNPHIDLSLLPALADEEAEAEGQLKDEALEEYTYSDDTIDVGAILNEQLLLEKPFRALCTEDCKGLCPSCGINLNEDACLCAQQPKSLAFAALKDFKPRN
jgi:uncharacterized protein